MDAFAKQLMDRSPLAGSVLELFDFVLDDQLLTRIWEAHRGRCYEDVLKFPDFLRLMRDGLINHGGSAHRLFVELERTDSHPIDESNFYRKLSRMPVELSRALLRECTQRLGEVMPRQLAVSLPACFDGFEAFIGDGKKIKNVAKRLAPTRGYSGKLLGAKALVGVNVRSGLAVASHDSIDGMTNDVPLVPGLMEQLRQICQRPILSIWDRQFSDVKTMRELTLRAGDAFVVRTGQLHACFAVESSVEYADEQGRRVLDEVGVLGKAKGQQMHVRRITLYRQAQGEENVVLLSNLLDRQKFAAADLLALYKERWGIERVFQEVTQTFSLEHVIGCKPKAVLLQFSFCLLLYNLMQVVKGYVAQDGKVKPGTVSMFYLFNDVRTELTAWAYHTQGVWPRMQREAKQMRQRLEQLLRGSWDPIAYTKASDKTPRPKPKHKPLLHGGHTSVQRLLEGKVRLAKT